MIQMKGKTTRPDSQTSLLFLYPAMMVSCKESYLINVSVPAFVITVLFKNEKTCLR